MKRKYRKGAIGALTDEYEKALNELKTLLLKLEDDNFKNEYNQDTETDFQSIRNIVMHVIQSGYAYSNYIRKRFGESHITPVIGLNTVKQGILELNEMFNYAVETFEDKWLLTDDELLNTIIKTSWTTYDLEAINEHAIVHILRHRRQIEKMIIEHEIINF